MELPIHAGAQLLLRDPPAAGDETLLHRRDERGPLPPHLHHRQRPLHSHLHQAEVEVK